MYVWPRSVSVAVRRQPAEGRDAEDRQRPDHVQLARAEALRDDEREHQRGERDQHVEHPHQDRVDGPAPVTGHHPEHAADHQADGGDGEAHLERDLAAVQDAGHDVVADRIGTEHVAR
jgi:hypothetical protein